MGIGTHQDLKREQMTVVETQFFQVGYARKLNHWWRTTHDNLGCVVLCIARRQMGLNHFLRYKSDTSLPFLSCRGAIDCIMQFKPVRIFTCVRF
jgi:hypothetical protein